MIDTRPTFDELIAEADAGWRRDCARPLSLASLTPTQPAPEESRCDAAS